jgi:AcrR family transcriptional regulator
VSARHAFAEAGYDGAGVRAIAKGAGVTAMLVNRYFGSKERLFAEVAADIMAAPTILTRQHLTSRTRGADMAAALVALTAAGATPLDGFRIMMYSAASARAAAIGREQIDALSQDVDRG